MNRISAATPAASTSRRILVTAGGLMLAGLVLSVLAETLHPHTAAPNDHLAAFAEYAASTGWVWVHDAQFASALVVLAGFVALYQSFARCRAVSVLDRCGLGAATATAAAIAVNMAIDGVALKQAVDAWATAPPAEKAVRFATAETVRWLEWGVNSFFQILLGLTLGMFSLAVIRHGGLARALGWLGLLTGVGLVYGGMIVGDQGFVGSAVATIAKALFALFALSIAAAGLRQPQAAKDNFGVATELT